MREEHIAALTKAEAQRTVEVETFIRIECWPYCMHACHLVFVHRKICILFS